MSMHAGTVSRQSSLGFLLVDGSLSKQPGAGQPQTSATLTDQEPAVLQLPPKEL